MLCFSVDSKDSLENVESKWVAEIAENCQGVKLVLVALKCDLREGGTDEDEDVGTRRGGGEKDMIDYKQGLEVAKRIQALRYLGMPHHSYSRNLMKVSLTAKRKTLTLVASTECSAKRNRGVNEAFTEAARVALSVKGAGTSGGSKCSVM